jgi:uncharacterized protein (DUF4415 family)
MRMAKKKSGSSQRGKVVRKKRKFTGDESIDFSDLPELTDEQLSSMRRVGRPTLGELPRQIIAIRIDIDVLERLRQIAVKNGKGYQTLINEILDQYVTKTPA